MKKLLLISSFALAFVTNVFAQPANDCPCNAVTITVGGGCVNGDNTGATADNACETGVQQCVTGGDILDASVWYRFQATDDSITVNLGDGTLGTAAFAVVYNAPNCSTFTSSSDIACAKSGNEVNATGLTVGTWYYILVDGGNQGGSPVEGTFCISVYETPPPPPPIGTCTNPRDLYPGPDCNDVQGRQYDEQNNFISFNASNGGDGGAGMTSTTSSIDGSCTGTDNATSSYWVKVNATNNTQLTFYNQGTTALDYAVFRATTSGATPTTCSTTDLTSVACVSVNGGSNTNVTGLTANTDYYVQITGQGSNNATTAFLCVTATTIYTPPNDNCANATSISTNTNYVLNNSNATVDANNTLCSGSTENNVWVKWTADFTGTAYVFLQDQDCIAGNGMQMSIFNAGASCPNSSSTCSLYINPNNDNDFSGNFSATSGSTYYIQLDGYAGAGCSFNFCISSSNSADCSILLPVEWANFNARYLDGKVFVEWQTATEINCDYYNVERSINGIEFETIATVKGSGNSSTMKSYSDLDSNPIKGLSYYRIIQKDFDGKTSYSRTIPVVVGEANDLFAVIPNPFTENVNINYNALVDGDAQLAIYDVTGKIVFSGTQQAIKGLNNINLDLTNLEKGVYFVSLVNGNKVLKSKLIKR